jgi:hypothetical protein
MLPYLRPRLIGSQILEPAPPGIFYKHSLSCSTDSQLTVCSFIKVDNLLGHYLPLNSMHLCRMGRRWLTDFMVGPIHSQKNLYKLWSASSCWDSMLSGAHTCRASMACLRGNEQEYGIRCSWYRMKSSWQSLVSTRSFTLGGTIVPLSNLFQCWGVPTTIADCIVCLSLLDKFIWSSLSVPGCPSHSRTFTISRQKTLHILTVPRTFK